MTQRSILLTITLLTLMAASTVVSAQNLVSGIVSTKSGPVIGANVYLEGTYDGASTDTTGYFSFETEVTGMQILVISHIAFNIKNLGLDLGQPNQNLEIVLAENLRSMDPLVITAGTFEAGVSGKGEVLKPLDIVTTAGATADIAGALNTLPGTTTVGEEGRLFVRGGDGDETITFIDGLGVLDSYATTIPNVATRSRFSPMMFGGMSFSTGGYSAEYGQALSSALILNTKSTAPVNRTDISLMTVGTDIAHTRSFKNSSISGKLQYTNLTPYMAIVKQRINWVKAPESLEGNFAYRYEKEGFTAKAFAKVNASTMTLDYVPVDFQDSTIRTTVDNQYYYANTFLSQVINKDWSVRGGVSYTRSNTGAEQPIGKVNDILDGGHIKIASHFDPVYFVSFNVGTEFFLNRFTQIHSDSRGRLTNDMDYLLNGNFLEADWYIHSKFSLRTGGRWEYQNLRNEWTFNPRVSAAFKIDEKSQMGASWGKFDQLPNNQFLRQNPLLENQQATHYIVSYQYSYKKRALRVELYDKEYDKLVKTNEENINNNGTGYARGIDIFWRDTRTFKNIDYWVSYSYLDTRRDYQYYPEPSTPAFASAHNLSVVYKHWFQTLRSQLGLTYSFASPRNYHNPNQEGFNQGRTPNYHSLSMNISYLMKPHIIIYFSLSNITGRKNVFGYEYGQVPNNEGIFLGREIIPPADRFAFLGVFITLSKNKMMNQLPNL